MMKSRLSLIALMVGLSLVGCKRFRGHGSNTDAGPLSVSVSAMPAMSGMPSAADTASAMAAASAAAAMGNPGATAGASCAKAVKCCHVLTGDATPACDALTNAPEVTCATTLTSYRKAVKASKPKRAAECD